LKSKLHLPQADRAPFIRLAEELLEKETLSLPEIVEIMGPRPFPMKESIAEYLQELKDRKVTEDELKEQETEAEAEKKKSALDQIKFDADAAEELEKEEEAAKKADESKEEKK
jgi:hypothetical protein